MASNSVASSPAAFSKRRHGRLVLERTETLHGGDAHGRVLVVQQRRQQIDRLAAGHLGHRRRRGGADGRLPLLRAATHAALPAGSFSTPSAATARTCTATGSDGTASAASVSADAGALIFSRPADGLQPQRLRLLAVLHDAGEEVGRLRRRQAGHGPQQVRPRFHILFGGELFLQRFQRGRVVHRQQAEARRLAHVGVLVGQRGEDRLAHGRRAFPIDLARRRVVGGRLRAPPAAGVGLAVAVDAGQVGDGLLTHGGVVVLAPASSGGPRRRGRTRRPAPRSRPSRAGRLRLLDEVLERVRFAAASPSRRCV